MLTRLARVRPFALHETMVPAAAVSVPAQAAIERYLAEGRARAARPHQVVSRVAGDAGGRQTSRRTRSGASPSCACGSTPCSRSSTCSRRDDPAQRARDRRLALGARRGGRRRADAARAVLRGAAGRLLPRPRHRRRHPPGADPAAGRRREPGGDHPRAARADGRQRHRLVAGPRGRPPGGGAARSRDVAAAARSQAASAGAPATTRGAWRLWERWISEIVADFWSVARVGVASTLGLIGVRQPAARVRLPHGHRRPAPDPLDPRAAQLRDRARAVSGSAMGAREPRSGRRSTPSTGCRNGSGRCSSACARRCRRSSLSCSTTGHPGSRAHAVAEVLPLASADAGAALGAAAGMGGARRLARRRANAGVRGHRAGAGRRAHDAGAREPARGRPAAALGSPHHHRRVRGVRARSGAASHVPEPGGRVIGRGRRCLRRHTW